MNMYDKIMVVCVFWSLALGIGNPWFQNKWMLGVMVGLMAIATLAFLVNPRR